MADETAARGDLGAGAAVALGAASGLAFALALPPFDLSAFAWVSFVPLCLAVVRCTARGALAAAAAAGLVLASQGMYGVLIYEPRLWVVVTLAVTLWPMAVVGLLLRVRAGDRGLASVVAAPTLWVAVETLLQEWLSLPTSIGITLARSEGARQAAALAGASGLSFLLVLTGALAAHAHALGRRGRPRGAWLSAALALAVPAVTTAAGRLALPDPSALGCVARARVVQPAIPAAASRRSWAEPAARAAIRRAFWDALAASRSSEADLFVWPEGGGAFDSFRVGPARAALYQEARSTGRHLFVSAIDFDAELDKRNSIFAFGPDGSFAKYDKLAPVPIAEATIAPGSRSGVVPTAHGRAGLLVCYESCFPRPAAALVRQGAAFLVVSANDADLGISTIPALHLSMSILRAVENRRPVIHASNAGPSAIIDPHGRIVAHAPLRAESVLEGCVFEPGADAPASRAGSAAERACQLAGCALVLAAGRPRRRVASGTFHWRALGVCALASLALAVANALVVGRQAAPPASPAEVLASFGPTRARAPSPAALSIPAEKRADLVAFLASYLGADGNGAEPREAPADLAAVARAAESLGFVPERVALPVEALAHEPLPLVLALRVLGPAVALALEDDGALLYHEHTGLQTVPLATLAQLYRGESLRVRPPSWPRPGSSPASPSTRSSAGSASATRETRRTPSTQR
jgi:apolipoprotein N-acyltransferase